MASSNEQGVWQLDAADVFACAPAGWDWTWTVAFAGVELAMAGNSSVTEPELHAANVTPNTPNVPNGTIHPARAISPPAPRYPVSDIITPPMQPYEAAAERATVDR